MAFDEQNNFDALVVMQFSSSTPAEIKDWTFKRITASHIEDEGAGFLARYETDEHNQVGDRYIPLNAT
jgi:hypothetical protein